MTDSPSNGAESAASRLLRRVARLPRPAIFLGVLMIGLVACFTPGTVGAILTGTLALAVAGFASLTWEHRTPAQRVLPMLVVVVLGVIAAGKVL